MFESLDFLYVPAPVIDSSVRYYTEVLGGKLLWEIHAYGVWVACVRISENAPFVLLADHIKKKDTILIYRVPSLPKAASEMKSRGWKGQEQLEIPQGPCYVFRDPADNAIAIYGNKRPYFMKEVEGRIDEK